MLEVLSGYETAISATVLSHSKRVMTLTPDALLKSVAAGVGQLAFIETFRQAVLRPTSNVAPSIDTGKSNFI